MCSEPLFIIIQLRVYREEIIRTRNGSAHSAHSKSVSLTTSQHYNLTNQLVIKLTHSTTAIHSFIMYSRNSMFSHEMLTVTMCIKNTVATISIVSLRWGFVLPKFVVTQITPLQCPQRHCKFQMIPSQDMNRIE